MVGDIIWSLLVVRLELILWIDVPARTKTSRCKSSTVFFCVLWYKYRRNRRFVACREGSLCTAVT